MSKITVSVFNEEIENIVKHNNIKYIDAIMHFCDKKSLEIDYVVSLIKKDQNLKEKLRKEGLSLNMLKE